MKILVHIVCSCTKNFTMISSTFLDDAGKLCFLSENCITTTAVLIVLAFHQDASDDLVNVITFVYICIDYFCVTVFSLSLSL